MRKKLANILQEIRLIGVRPAAFRIRQIIKQRFGWDVTSRPITAIDQIWFGPFPEREKGQDFVTWWRTQDTSFFIPEADANYIQGDHAALIERGHAAATGKIRAFYGRQMDFGWPINWNANPAEGTEWPALHSYRLLTAENKKTYGDIKNTWEIGRFLHVPDIVRAWAVSGDDGLMTHLIEQVKAFEKENPMYQGPHWVSEQEVAIRGAMLAYALYATKSASFWSEENIALFLRQIAAAAEYCMEDNDFARICVRNNHFIAGALAPYIAASVMPWHPRAAAWRKTSRKWLLEALSKQWYEDGGYIQPSHNYHRLAISYFLWVYRISENEGDDELSSAVLSRLSPAFDLLYSMMLGEKGELPNWGANDGALFGLWTDCDYADFRPVLSAMFYAISGRRVFDHGPWDEHLFWLWGGTAVSNSERKSVKSTRQSFPQAGLHVMHDRDLSVVLRAGPVLSRYGQQADQLHVDAWWKGQNVFLDPGSYSYHDPEAHDWFRATRSHNTMSVAEQDQMRPYRQFLYLDWPRVDILDLPAVSAPVSAWAGAVHRGYLRLPEKILHARLVIMLRDGQGCLIVDRISGQQEAQLVQNWTLESLDWTLQDKCLSTDDFAMCWDSNIPLEPQFHRKGHAWLSRYYGVRRDVASLKLSCRLSKYTRQINVMWCGPQNMKPEILKVNTAEDMIQCGYYNIPLPRKFLDG